MSSCTNCGCACPTGTTCCNNCGASNCVVPARPIQSNAPGVVAAGKYASVYDSCGQPRLLNYKSQSILTSNLKKTKLSDGSETDPIYLGLVKSDTCVQSVFGLNGSKLVQIKLGTNQFLYSEDGNLICAKDFVNPACFPDSEIPEYTTGGSLAFLKDDGNGNMCLEHFVCDCDPCDPGFNYIFSFDCNGVPICHKFFDLDNPLDTCALYYWNSATNQPEVIPPPVVAVGQTIADYHLKYTDPDGCPAWVLVTSSSACPPAMGLFSKGSVTAVTNTSNTAISLAKDYDGDGLSPRFGGAGCITVTKKGQVSVHATGQVQDASSGGQISMFWHLEGAPVGIAGQVFADTASAGPMVAAIWAGEMEVGESLCLFGKTDFGAANILSVSAVVHHFAEIA